MRQKEQKHQRIGRFKSSQRDYSKTIVIAKRKSWRKFCEDIETASRLSEIFSKDDLSHLDCLKLSNKEYIKSVEKSLRHLMFHSFSRV